jgi:hypothetical protein
MRHPIDFDGINAVALRSARQLLQELLPGGKFQGDEYVVRNPLRNDQHPGSFKINWKTGEWSDFAIGKSGGDLISLVAYLRGISQGDALRELAAKVGIPVPKLSGAPASANAEKRDASLVMPLPADAPAPTTVHPALGRPNQSWPYKDAAGGVIGYVLRFDGADGKEFRPLTLWRDSVSGRLEWRWQSWPPKRPLYGLQELADRPVVPVVVCEGEKATDAARRLLPSFVVVTSPNGNQSANKADWSPLRGRDVVIWPDADLPGDEYAEGVNKCAADAKAKSIAVVSPPEAVKEGWDAADALDEGWTPADAAKFIAGAVSWEPKTATDPLDGLVERAQADAGAPFTSDVLQRLAALKTEDRAAFEALRAELKRAGVRVVALDESIADESEEDNGGRPKQADLLIKLSEAAELFRTPDGTGFADIDINGHRETWPIRSKGFRRWLSRCFFEETKGAPNSEALQSALNVIEARAHFDAPERQVFVRVGGIGERIYLDLGDEAWRAVEIDATGWRMVDNPPVRFRRASGMQSLPEPVPGGSVETLRGFLNVRSDVHFVLAIAWLIAALRHCGPYPVLVLSGEQGSAKSTFSTILRALVDPITAPLRALPREDRDLFIAASNGHVLIFDNVSGLPYWISDTLCRLATGGGFAVRQLYTDQDEVLFDACRPMILNGIEDIVARPDLADRAIFLTLEPIPEEQRRPEQELLAEFESKRALILGALLDAVAHGLRQLPRVRLDRLPRMADFARWSTACETAIWPAGTFWAAYCSNRDEAVADVIEADPVANAVRALMATRTTWTGTASDLLGALTELVGEAQRKSKSWPNSPSTLSGRLRRAATFLRKAGIEIAFDRETNHKRSRSIYISVRPESGGDFASAPSASSAPDESTGSDAADDTDANNTPHSGVNSTPGTTVIDL